MTASRGMVYVVDDDDSVRKSLARLLTLAGYHVEPFASAREFMEHPRPSEPSCLVLDVKMPGPSGLDLQQMLAAAGKRMAIVFLTGHGDVPMSVRAMKGGAVDFLTKPCSAEDLLGAVERAVARDTREREERRWVTEVESRAEALTPREAQVLGLVVRGLLNRQIATELGISEKTVKVHRARVMQKMHSRSVTDLVRMVAAMRAASDTR